MASYLTQFHYLSSNLPAQFDYEAEDFSVKQIYQFYALKHERTPLSLWTDRMFAASLDKFSTDKRDYEWLYVKTKALAHVANQWLFIYTQT